MKKVIVTCMIAAVMVLMVSFPTPSHAQAPATDDTPTFYHLLPGTYVNGWPRFTIHYPKDWVEKRPLFFQALRVVAPGPALSSQLSIVVGTTPVPLDQYAELPLKVFRAVATDVTLISDKPTQLRDGTPAREVKFRYVQNGVPVDQMELATKRGDTLIAPHVESYGGKIGEDLKAIIYSLEFQPGFDKPVKVPPDVQEFIDKSNDDYVSHDLAKYMTHFSDAYLNSGVRKGEMERFFRQVIGFATSAKAVITDFVPDGDRAYYAGFVVVNGAKNPIQGTIIKENGEWRFYGNQRDAAP